MVLTELARVASVPVQRSFPHLAARKLEREQKTRRRVVEFLLSLQFTCGHAECRNALRMGTLAT